jgi:hypothetical protein
MNEEIINVAGCGDQVTVEVGTCSPVISVNGRYGYIMLSKSDVGLDQVDNTSDWDKPLSLATTLALANAPYWDITYTSLFANSAIWTQAVEDMKLYLPLSGGRMSGDLTFEPAKVIALGDVVLTDEYVPEPLNIARQYRQLNEYIKIFVNGSVPRFIPLFEFDLMVQWTDEEGNALVTENGFNLIF